MNVFSVILDQLYIHLGLTENVNVYVHSVMINIYLCFVLESVYILY